MRMPAARASDEPPAVPVPPGFAPAVALAAGATHTAGIPGVTANGLPQSAADSARMIRVVPARRPTYASEQATAPATPARDDVAGGVAPVAAVAPAGATPSAASGAVSSPMVARPPVASPREVPVLAGPTSSGVPASPDGYDRLRMRDGRVLRGRVELVRVGAVVFRDAATGLRYEYPKSDLDAVVTEFGSTVRFSPGDARAVAPGGSGGSGAAATTVERASALLVRRGVGGRYLVRFAVESVNGSPECRRAWTSAPPPEWARVAHAPGADTLAVTFEGGSTFASVIDEQAQFASTFVIVPDQAYSGSALTTRLSGRFAAGGFDAAVNIVGYRRVSQGRDVACHTVLRAVGRRAER
jgi:hypothetical protein